MANRPRSDWTPQMIADFKLFWEEMYGKDKTKKEEHCPVRADVELDIGV